MTEQEMIKNFNEIKADIRHLKEAVNTFSEALNILDTRTMNIKKVIYQTCDWLSQISLDDDEEIDIEEEEEELPPQPIGKTKFDFKKLE